MRFRRYGILLAVVLVSLLLLTLQTRGGGTGRAGELVAIAVTFVILWLARRLRSMPWAVSLGLILGGALGNLIDRLFRAPGPLQGHVVDFISVFAPAGQRFPIFNAADSALFCGVVLAIILEFTGRRRDGTRVRAVSDATGPSGNARLKP